MRHILAALFCLPSFAYASSQCVMIESSNSEVCRSWDGSGLDITYRGALISAQHGVYAQGSINGVAFSQLLEVQEPTGSRLSAFANVWTNQSGTYDVQLSFVDDTGLTENSSGKPFQFRLE
jgi:hypothetical protein